MAKKPPLVLTKPVAAPETVELDACAREALHALRREEIALSARFRQVAESVLARAGVPQGVGYQPVHDQNGFILGFKLVPKTDGAPAAAPAKP